MRSVWKPARGWKKIVDNFKKMGEKEFYLNLDEKKEKCNQPLGFHAGSVRASVAAPYVFPKK